MRIASARLVSGPVTSPIELAGLVVRGEHPRLGSVVLGELATPVGERRIPESGGAMGVLGGTQRRHQWASGALGHRNVGSAAQFEQAEVVDAHLVDWNVARRGGQADEFGVLTGEQIRQRHCVVHAGVDVREDGQGFIHALCVTSARREPSERPA